MMAAPKGFDLGALLKNTVESALTGALSGAKGDALKNVMFALNQAREGSLRLLLVFRTPDGKIEHVRILMSPEEAMAACKTTFRAIKGEVDAQGQTKGGRQ
jgi:hypothetical protein